MNMFKAFESRVAEAFGASQQGITAPFSFRKLAKRAAREMEQETYVVDGVDTAPALITILVSADDDSIMRSLYPQLTEEIANFVEAEAARKGYVFVGKPLARFMVDPSLRRGRFAVFANNVDAVTLEKLRQEEVAFLSGFGALVARRRPARHAHRAPRMPSATAARDRRQPGGRACRERRLVRRSGRPARRLRRRAPQPGERPDPVAPSPAPWPMRCPR